MLTDESYITVSGGRGGGGEPEREERGREGGREAGRQIFFHCMPAAALISWSILVNCFRDSRLCH